MVNNKTLEITLVSCLEFYSVTYIVVDNRLGVAMNIFAIDSDPVKAAMHPRR